MKKDDFVIERTWFESWYKKQFPKCENLLRKGTDFDYFDSDIRFMFAGFCAGFEIAGKFDC